MRPARSLPLALTALAALTATLIAPTTAWAAEAELTPGPEAVTASTSDDNVPADAVDGDLTTRWSGEGDNAWLRLDLGTTHTVTHVKLAVHRGTTRRNLFELQHWDGSRWVTIHEGRTSGTTTALETFTFDEPVETSRIRYLGHGYEGDGEGDWNSLTEIEIWGDDDGDDGGGDDGGGGGGDDELPYGTDGNGNPRTDDCTVRADSDPQAAVDDASDGDIVCVRPGDHSDTTLVVDKPITVRANGPVTVRNIVVSGSDATVDGFTVVGDALDDPSTGIKFSGSGHTITGNLVTGKRIHYAIACDYDDCASDVLISRNTVTGTNNFGVYLWGGSDITVEWNNIYDLWSDDGNDDVDGMRVWGSGHTIRNNYVHDLNANKGEGEPHADCVQTYQNSGRTVESHNVTVENNYCVRVSGQCLIMQNGHRPTADIRDFTYRGNVCESFGSQNIELGSVPGAVIENNILLGGVDGHVLTFHGTVDDLDTTDVRLRNNILVSAGGSTYADGSRDALTDDTDNIELLDPSVADDWREFEGNPDAPVRAINPDDFTRFRAVAQGADVVDEGSAPHSPGFVQDVDGASRVRGAAIDIGPFELA
ncbi:discoidin domain-containing protein [Streptomyces radicis]|uniref:discoidin domain-containing protein n=1 Tax=Streptomyces radicis TaxID=1750517 RepID=UPI0016047598|nr:discoidin domain-containing protein [Streptomyces radicis]